jgi:hypothetical protein
MTIQIAPQPAILSLSGGLLSHARGLVAHEKEIERATASRFNLFHIFGVGYYEVSTHSALLANLLDPLGSHAQGPAFLNRFLQSEAILKAPGFPVDFHTDSAVVECEVSIGYKTETTGGRLDILITDRNGRKIAIENKIRAAEQDNWVERYLNFLGDDGCLIYLTKFGDDPAQARTEELRNKVHCISYAETIKSWLEVCRKEAAIIPIVRESITQYIYLINDLTHQNRDTRMNEQLAELALNNASAFDAYCALRDANKPIKGQIVRELGERIRPKVPDGFNLVTTPKGSCEKYDGFAFSTPFLNACNVQAVISFDSPEYGNCYYGFELIDPTKPFGRVAEDLEMLIRCFKTVFEVDPASSGRWPAWKHWMPQNWTDGVLRKIKFEPFQFEKEFLSLVSALLAVEQEFVRKTRDCPTA